MTSEIIVGIVVGTCVGVLIYILTKIIPEEFAEWLNQKLLFYVFCRGDKRRYSFLMRLRSKKNKVEYIHKEDPSAQLIQQLKDDLFNQK